MKPKLLLVEDEFDTRELLTRALKRADYPCIAAENLQQALTCVDQHPDIGLVITDIVLGQDERGGLQLLTMLAARNPRLPVVITTAYADVDKLKVALNSGAAYFLEKPFRAPQLIDAIERALASPRTPRPDAARTRVEQLFAAANLTEKERAVARHLLECRNSSEIAALENNSPKTIRQHVSQIYAKCGVASRAEFLRLLYVR
ncbi:MAG: response regulator transcription factor [Myxococcota bacterium]